MDDFQIALAALVALYGALVGSFLNVVIFRLPREGASIAFPASHCPACKTPLHWYENIPIFSYLALLGRCHTCKTAISLQYPLVEALTAILAALLWLKFGLSFDLFFYFLFCASLVVIIFIDIRHQIIPDRISLPGIVIGFAGSFFSHQVNWQHSLLGLLIGGGILYTVAWLYMSIKKREGMGGGDIKLLAMIGAFLGWQSLLYVVFCSSITGSVIGIALLAAQKRGAKARIPFGPFLAFGALTYLLLDQQIAQLWRWYLQSFGG